MKFEKKTIKRIFLVSILLNILLVSSTLYVVFSSNGGTFTISSGIYPRADFTIWKEGSTYYAKSAYGSIDSGTNKIQLIQDVQNVVDNTGGTIYLKGLSFPSEVSLSSNVVIFEEYQGKLKCYRTRTFLFYEGVYREGATVRASQSAVAIADGLLPDIIDGGDTWTKLGWILSPQKTFEELRNLEPTVIYEDNLFKCWFRTGDTDPNATLSYAESYDGINWRKFAGNPILNVSGESHWCPFVLKYDETYYLYVHAENWATVDRYNSTNGLTWTKDKDITFTVGSGGEWDDQAIGNIFVWVESANDWRMIYEAKDDPAAIWKLGYATSADGKTWSRSGSNPVLDRSPKCAGGPHVEKIGSTYYMWFHGSPVSGTLPTQIYRVQSPNLLSWSNEVSVLNRTLSWESSQVADACLVAMVYCEEIP